MKKKKNMATYNIDKKTSYLGTHNPSYKVYYWKATDEISKISAVAIISDLANKPPALPSSKPTHYDDFVSSDINFFERYTYCRGWSFEIPVAASWSI